LGYGVCSSRLEFVERGLKDEDFYNSYAQYLQQDFIKKGKPVDMSVMHPHNALLETWIQFGIVGVLILCVLIVLSLTMHLGKYQLFLNLCIFAFLLQSIFESLGNELKPIYLCLLVLLWHSQYINSQCNNEQASFQPR
jgi:O-antigen ligase